MLQMVNMETMNPDAVQMRTCDTMQIAEGMAEIFSRLGVPQKSFSDRASTFTSDVMRAVNRPLSMEQLMTTPYGLIYNGLVEKFNGTIKQMIRKVYQERPVDWDRYLPAVLFAYRVVPEGYLGFYPFHMRYRCTIRCLLTILKER